MPQRRAYLQQIATWIVVAVAALGLLLFLLPSARGWIVERLWPHEPRETQSKAKQVPVELIHDAAGHAGLRISQAALDNLQVDPTPVSAARDLRPLPPQMGTVNYDNDFLFTIRPRFSGEIVSFKQVIENPYPQGPTRQRDLSFGDRIKQGEVLAVFWSREVGQAKAALVDAIIARSLSEEIYKRHLKLFNEGNISEATFLQTERQLRTDRAAYNNALRPLHVWKVPEDEITQVEREAANLLKNPKKERDPKAEIERWARVEIKAPIFARDKDGRPDPDRELTIVEKNVGANEFVDPGRDLPLFKLADLTRLQVWIHPPEEYLPMLRAQLNRNGPGLRVIGRFQSDTVGNEPLELTVSRIAPSIDSTLRTPMLIAELKNPERSYLIGQFVSATIYAPPPLDTVAVPTAALNIVDGQYLVFARPANGKDNEYYRRRVAVAQSAGKTTLVRTKLTAGDIDAANSEKGVKRLPLQALEPGDVVLTRGVVELTAALDDLLSSPGKKD